MKCSRCDIEFENQDEAIVIRRGIWSEKAGMVLTLDYGNDMPMEITMCKKCFQKLASKPNVVGQRVGFFVDGKLTVKRILT